MIFFCSSWLCIQILDRENMLSAVILFELDREGKFQTGGGNFSTNLLYSGLWIIHVLTYFASAWAEAFVNYM